MTGQTTGKVLAQRCQEVAEALIVRYGWRLLKADELAAQFVSSANANDTRSGLEERARGCYARKLYQTCLQDQDSRSQELAYRELHRFLFRTACSRWRGLPQENLEELAQQALELVFEKRNKCKKPEAFLLYASWLLREVARDFFRGRWSVKELDQEEMQVEMPDTRESADLQSQVEKEALIQALLDAIDRLPNERMKNVFLLKLDRLSDAAIGAQLGITANYVRVLRNEGKGLLRQDEALRRLCETEAAHRTAADRAD